MIPARLTGDGTCTHCGQPTALLPAKQRVGRGGETHWSLCTACWLRDQQPVMQPPETRADFERRHGLDEPEPNEDLEDEFARRMGDR